MNYDETIEYINNESKKGSIYGLDTINNFLDKLNRPDSYLNINQLGLYLMEQYLQIIHHL